MHVKKGDSVTVISGKDKGKSGDLSGVGPLVDALGAEFDKVEVEIRRLLNRGAIGEELT